MLVVSKFSQNLTPLQTSQSYHPPNCAIKARSSSATAHYRLPAALGWFHESTGGQLMYRSY